MPSVKVRGYKLPLPDGFSEDDIPTAIDFMAQFSDAELAMFEAAAYPERALARIEREENGNHTTEDTA